MGEGAIELDHPGGKICGMRTATLVMLEKPLLQIFGKANVGLFRVIRAAQNIHVKHAPAWFCDDKSTRSFVGFFATRSPSFADSLVLRSVLATAYF